MMSRSSLLTLSDEVRTALEERRPVVALESTIIAHGMPYPQNVETAMRVEATVRDAGAVPATCAIMGGRMKAGLSQAEIEQLGKEGTTVAKASRRDLPFLLSNGQAGATTVAATMMIAHAAGIRIFATGGIGGVHRGAEQSFDISADLQELAQTPVAVVCAGAKSILDLLLTLEYLETHGVPVIGYQTAEFPAFYSHRSGLGVDARLDTPQAIAAALWAKWQIDERGGAVIANPVPSEYAQDPDLIESITREAIREAAEQGIKGKRITPFLLSRIQQLTAGESLATNIELVCNNARLAAAIAVALVGMKG